MNPSGFLDSGDIRRLKRSLDITAFYQLPISVTQGLIPSGGTAGQVLSKVNGVDYNVTWSNGVPGTVGPVGPPADVHPFLLMGG